LVFKCALTKWVEYFAVKDKSALCIAECFVDEILMRHGAPKVLISDGGREFDNQILKSNMQTVEDQENNDSTIQPEGGWTSGESGKDV
jgi:hypothetical protein